MGRWPDTKMSMSPAAMIFSFSRVAFFLGGGRRSTSSGVIRGRSISTTLWLTWFGMGDMREPENEKDAFLMVWMPAILLSNSAVSYWFGAKATRTWQLLTMLSYGPYSSTIWRTSCVIR